MRTGSATGHRRLAFFDGQPVEDPKQLPAKGKQQTPVVALALKQLVGDVLAEGLVVVAHNAAEEVLTDQGQCEYGFGQRVYTIP